MGPEKFSSPTRPRSNALARPDAHANSALGYPLRSCDEPHGSYRDQAIIDASTDLPPLPDLITIQRDEFERRAF